MIATKSKVEEIAKVVCEKGARVAWVTIPEEIKDRYREIAENIIKGLIFLVATKPCPNCGGEPFCAECRKNCHICVGIGKVPVSQEEFDELLPLKHKHKWSSTRYGNNVYGTFNECVIEGCNAIKIIENGHIVFRNDIK